MASSKLEETYNELHGAISTSACIRNTYTTSYGKKIESGQRIDHILYRSGAGYEVKKLNVSNDIAKTIK